MATLSPFEQVVRITHAYLGPAADRFVSRQITNHLDKKPQDLTLEDMAGLTDWLRVAMSFLTEDQGLVRDYVELLSALQPKEVPDSESVDSLGPETKPTKRKGRLATHADAN